MIDHFGAPWVSQNQYQLRKDARRFETWENAYALRAGLGVAIDYALNIGLSEIQTRVTHLANHCREALTQIKGLELRDLGHQPCGIVSFSIAGADARERVSTMHRFGFVLGASEAASTRLDFERRALPTLFRIAPHYYNTEEEISACVQKLAALT